MLMGCAGRERGEVVEFWAMGREGEVVTQLLPEFEAANPGVRVKVQQLPWTAAHEKLLTAFAGDATPDLCALGASWVPEFVALGALEDLAPRIAASTVVDPADYFAGAWDTNAFPAGTFGVPWYVDTRLLFYRRDLVARAGFPEPPTTWEEWRRQLAAVKEHAVMERGGPEKYSVLLPLNEFEPLLVLALQQPSPLLRDGGRYGNFESEDFLEAFGFYVEMFRRGWAPKATNTEISNVWQEFGRGVFSFYITGPWNIGEFKRRLPAELQGTWMTAPMPGPDGPGSSFAGGTSLVVFRASRQKDAAWRLIEHLSRPEVQVRFHALTGNLPPRRTPWADPLLAGHVYVQAFRQQLERLEPTPKVAEWERIAQQMRLVSEAAVEGRLTVAEAARALDRDVDRMLEKRRFMLARGTALDLAAGGGLGGEPR